ncbi:hypothetical protein KFE25_004743 [Diacronema lutheri]|uniref:Uncharacterized protein n=1 Tax=Diacronema lutheri TaxID=2081491 RepID=A0A8J5XJZ3_DIALT|nr:hypothetical protein KFE25_004743 [Diacronema lutheri]
MTGPLTAGVEARRLSAPEARRPRLSGGNVELDVSALISRAEVPTLVAQLLHERADTAEPPLEPLAAERCALDAYDEAARQNDGIVLLDEFSATVANVLLSLASRMLRSPALDAPGTDGPRADGSVDDANIASGADGPADGATHADEIDLLVLADLVSILANRSAAPVTNTDLQFAFDERGIPTAAPDDLSARTTGGLALDLGKHSQRLLTPWGCYSLRYTLSFPPYNTHERVNGVRPSSARRSSAAAVAATSGGGASNGLEPYGAAPLAPTTPSASVSTSSSASEVDFAADCDERVAAERGLLAHVCSVSLFLFACRPSQLPPAHQLLALSRVPHRVVFIVEVVNGRAPSCRAALVEADDDDGRGAPAERALRERFDRARAAVLARARAAAAKSVEAAAAATAATAAAAVEARSSSALARRVSLASADMCSACPLIDEPLLLNRLLGKKVLVQDEEVAALEERIRKSRTAGRRPTPPSTEELKFALSQASSTEAAYKLWRARCDALDRLVGLRRGYSTREWCAEVLTICRADQDIALYALDNEAEIEAATTELLATSGLASATGFPTREQVVWEVALARANRDAAAAALREQWAADMRHLRQIAQGEALEDLLDRLRTGRFAEAARAHSHSRAALLGQLATDVRSCTTDARAATAGGRAERLAPFMPPSVVVDEEEGIGERESAGRSAHAVAPPAAVRSFYPGRAHVEALLARGLPASLAPADVSADTPLAELELLKAERLLCCTTALLRDASAPDTAGLGCVSRADAEALLIEFGGDEGRVRALLRLNEYVRTHRQAVGSPSRGVLLAALERASWRPSRAIEQLRAVYRLISPRVNRRRAMQPASALSAAHKVDGRVVRHVLTAANLVVRRTVDSSRALASNFTAVTVAPHARAAAEVALVVSGWSEEDAVAFLVRVAKAQLHAPKLARSELEYAAVRAYAAHGVAHRVKVTHDEILAHWRQLDAFVAAAQPYGEPSRSRAREVLHACNGDEAVALAKLTAAHGVAELSKQLDLGLCAETIDKLLAQYGWDAARLERFLRGMHELQRKAESGAYAGFAHAAAQHAARAPCAEDLEAILHQHGLDAEKAHQHLLSLSALRRDRALLADAGEPSDAILERALHMVGYDSDKSRQLLILSQQLVRACARWGAPSREHVEEILLREGLDRAKAHAALRTEYSQAQFQLFRAQQAERRARQAAEVATFSLAGVQAAPPERERPGNMRDMRRSI